MRALTLGQARATIGRVINKCPTSDEVPLYLNDAQERLLNRGDYPVGALVKYRLCVGQNSCLSWPRQIRTIEAFALCNTPGVVRSSWFEFIGWPAGNGLQEPGSCAGTSLIDRDTACAFDDVIATTAEPRRIAVIADNAADAGKTIVLRYYDSTGQRVYKNIGGVIQEGEQLTLVAPGGALPAGAVITSNHVFTGGLYAVIKAVTDYPVRLYEINDANVITKSLAQYEPSETNPIYRRSLVPGLTQRGPCCGQSSEDCTNNQQLTALVKLQHVPVVVDNDPLVIGNLAALKLMVMAILREEDNRHQEAAILRQQAKEEIDGELSSYLGTGVRDVLKVAADFGAGNIQSDLMWGYNW